ncbi:hypothetical protein [uncultured Streptococcus sp.]|jgi:hypothetical protein|uniref:hypothetical protein n=1 Tax=uncultured Streptococcus sp. TaxID=83427 RepID=UPI002064DA9F|nr:hypothetical protein [uncultured Streptococcus sp.]MDU1740124.1 hypothetical protein [Streptococcus mitis]DAK27790.1 MAG TPA: hypothetical protein [Bacteriophage sp.]DAP83325.1 MAG TPA: hypothetical protein [Caudoviricetes sp.]DAX40154.1 MAG TPA: hypothetical protein [Caudoviricetes sp.]
MKDIFLPLDKPFQLELSILDPKVNPEHCRVGQTEKEIIVNRKEVRKDGAFR